MSFIPEITCRNCGTKYSALRGRCPNCGARHEKRSNREAPAAAAGTESASAGRAASVGNQWQMIFGGILIVAVIVAVIILISASLRTAEAEETVAPPPVADVSSPPPPTPSPPPPPSPTVAVTSVNITFLGSPVGDSFTQRISWDPINLDADVYPKEALNDAEVTWRSSNEEVCTVDQEGIVTAVGQGTCEIIAECGGIAAKCTVLVP